MPDMREGSGLSWYEGNGGSESAVKFMFAMLASAVVLNSVKMWAQGALFVIYEKSVIVSRVSATRERG
jgi:hypothetical protein